MQFRPSKLLSRGISFDSQGPSPIGKGVRRFLLTVGSFLLPVELLEFIVDNFSFSLAVGVFCLQLSLFYLQLEFFADSGKVRLIRALRDCKQRIFTVSKETPIVSKKNFPLGKVSLKMPPKFRGFAKGWFSKRVVLADVPPEHKPERGCIRMFPRNENWNEGTLARLPRNENRNKGIFAKTNHPFIGCSRMSDRRMSGTSRRFPDIF